MKKIYISGLVILASVSTIFGQTAPTCSLNPTFISGPKVGVFPDSATAFVNGTVGVPYVQNITIKVPKDTVVTLPFKLCFNRFELKSPAGVTNFNLPPGLSFTVTPSLMSSGVIFFPGNANNCASIFGTPTLAGSYTLTLKVQPFVTPQPIGSCSGSPNVNSGSGSLAAPQILSYYIINIAPAVGVRELKNDRMSLSQNFPNPSSLSTEIKFYVEGNDIATVAIYNMLGNIVSSQTIKTVVGENKVTINTSELAAGTYVYNLKYKSATSTKRMIVLNH